MKTTSGKCAKLVKALDKKLAKIIGREVLSLSAICFLRAFLASCLVACMLNALDDAALLYLGSVGFVFDMFVFLPFDSFEYGGESGRLFPRGRFKPKGRVAVFS